MASNPPKSGKSGAPTPAAPTPASSPAASLPEAQASQKQTVQKQASEKHAPRKTVGFSSTTMAIAGSLVIAIVLASLMLNPVEAFRMAYTNAAGEVPASIATEGTAPAATARQGVQESEKPAN